jgi:hypothetical protein
MRYFKDSLDTKLIALPSDPHGSLSCWIHWDSNTFPGGHSITREHLKAWEVLSALTELTEEQARAHDPEMFSECLDQPYNDAPSILQFYIQRAQECVDFEPAAKQVLRYLVDECGYSKNGPMRVALESIENVKEKEFGIVAYDGGMVHYMGIPDLKDGHYSSVYAQDKINSPSTHRIWWRYNTLEKNLTPEVFNDRMRRI